MQLLIAVSVTTKYWMQSELRMKSSYQKSARPGRKAGHVVVVGDELLPILEMCREVAAVIHGGDYDA